MTTPATPDFRLYPSNTLELLAALLADELRRPVPGQALLAPDIVLIPQVASNSKLLEGYRRKSGVAEVVIVGRIVPDTGRSTGDAGALGHSIPHGRARGGDADATIIKLRGTVYVQPLAAKLRRCFSVNPPVVRRRRP